MDKAIGIDSFRQTSEANKSFLNVYGYINRPSWHQLTIIVVHKIYETFKPFIIVHPFWIEVKSIQIYRIHLQSYHKVTCKSKMALSKFDELAHCLQHGHDANDNRNITQ